MKLILTCEHGGNDIPIAFGSLFSEATELLNTHRGYDLGALDVFFACESLFEQSFYSTTSRLLIELNRSQHHPNLFSSVTKSLSKAEKKELIENYYLPYRNQVENCISKWIKSGEEIFHLSVHSFTPVMDGETRNCDLSFLYDPEHGREKEICKSLKKSISSFDKELLVRYNYPYKGTADGFTTYLRKTFNDRYNGIEMEINQKFSDQNKMNDSLKEVLLQAIQQTIAVL